MNAAVLENYRSRLRICDPLKVSGLVVQVVGLTVEAVGVDAPVGEVCEVMLPDGEVLNAEVVGFRNRRALLMPLGDSRGVAPDCRVIPRGRGQVVSVGPGLLGRVINAMGKPLDNTSLEQVAASYPVDAPAPSPLERQRINRPLESGIRAIDGLLTLGEGQRVGIFAGSGVGKSTLLGMIARHSGADVNVIALIGERGREVLDFLERDLGTGLAKSVVVVATSDQPALQRLKGALVATAIAEYFRDQGKSVMLMMDSLTRFAMAQREVGLAVGEPPSSRGYTPSVFALLPRLLERAGKTKTGSITGLYTVLVDADDMNDPIADAARSILDGHVILSRRLANRNHYPPIDVLASISRLMPEVTSSEHRYLTNRMRNLMAAYEESEDLINIGAYQSGSNPEVDDAIRHHEPMDNFLRQDIDEISGFTTTLESLRQVVG